MLDFKKYFLNFYRIFYICYDVHLRKIKIVISLPLCLGCLFFHCFMTILSSIILSRCNESGYSCLITDLKWKAFSSVIRSKKITCTSKNTCFICLRKFFYSYFIFWTRIWSISINVCNRKTVYSTLVCTNSVNLVNSVGQVFCILTAFCLLVLSINELEV